MTWKYRDGRLSRYERPPTVAPDKVGYEELLKAYKNAAASGLTDEAVGVLVKHAQTFNAFIEANAPWKLAKSAQASDKQSLDIDLYNLAEALRIIAILISPVTPKAAHGIFDQLNWKMESELRGKEARFSLADAEWGKLPDGHIVGKPTPLFPRIEADSRAVEAT
jgi:methionyl-tRNA synthetase